MCRRATTRPKSHSISYRRSYASVEIYGVELTEEHRLDLSNVRTRVRGDEELRNVMTGDNSETNKRRKFEEVIGTIFLSYVNDRVDFYQKFENPVIRDLIVDVF